MLPAKPIITFIAVMVMALALAFLCGGCASPAVGPNGQPTTQPAVTVDTVLSLVIADYDLAVSQGWVKPTPAFDAAVKAYFQAEADLSAGKGTLVAVNDALLTLAAETAKARQSPHK